MKGPQEQYTDEMKQKFGFIATWLPGAPLSLGDVGTIKDSVFTRIAGLEDFDVQFETKEDDSGEDIEYSSKGSVAVTMKASGTAAPKGSSLGNIDAGFIVDFSNENSVFFKANQVKTHFIKNTKAIGDAVLRLYSEGKWEKKWVVITELVSAASATILISNTVNAKIELKANASVEAAKLDIADAKFEFGPTFYKGLETKILAQTGLNPLFKVQGIKTRIFNSPIFRQKGVEAFDFVTPETAKNRFKDDLYFSYISSDERE